MSEPRGIINLIYRSPLDMTYQHQIDFKTPSEQISYWGSKIKYRLSDYTYIRRDRRSIKVNKRFDDLEGINYLAYQAHSGNNTKWYYCFVTDRAYVNDETTTIYFEIDVFQTYMFDYTFKPTYISQAHVNRWDVNHKPIYSKTDEGLNYGSEYITEKAYRMVADSKYRHGFYLIYCKGLPLPVDSADGETLFTSYENDIPENTNVIGNPIPYIVLLVPEILSDNDSQLVCGLRNFGSLSNMKEVQRFMLNSAFGNYVSQIVYLPYLPLPYQISDSIDSDGEFDCQMDLGFECSYETLDTTSLAYSGIIKFLVIKNIAPSQITKNYADMNIFSGLEEKIPSDEMWNALKASPRTTERDRRFESKLLCFPYRYNIFTDWVSTPALIKNEYITGDKISIKGSIGFGFNIPRRYWIENYRNDPEGREASINQLIPFEQPIMSDAYYTYMLENRNQISANITNATVSAITSAGTAVVSGAIGGASAGIPGAVAGAIGGAFSSAVTSAVNISNMLRSENAKQKDIKNIPDTFINSSDCTLAIADDARYITWYRKAISCIFEEQLAQYWHMYGYKVNQLEVPNLRSRIRYNYIKTIGANIEGAIESNYLATLKAIFDNGVTIWHYSEKDFNPLDYTYENPEVTLL